jgi:hypothetical protein
VESALREQLARRFPHHGIIGEELAEQPAHDSGLSGRSILSTERQISSTAFRSSRPQSACCTRDARSWAPYGARSVTRSEPGCITCERAADCNSMART